MIKKIIDQEQLALVVEATGVGIWDWNVISGHIACNDRYAEIIGYTVEELMPMNINILAGHFHPQDLATATTTLEAHWNDGKLYEVEVRMWHKEGHYVWVLVTGKTVEWDSDRKPVRMLGTHQDITARKQQEEALEISRELLNESQKIAKVGGWQLDVQTGNLVWTDETYRIHDTTPNEFNPSVDAGVDYFLPESKQLISHALAAAMEQAKDYDLELETYTTKGRKIDVRTTGHAILEGGKVTKLKGIFQDITEHKNALKAQKFTNLELKKINQQLKYSAHYDQLTSLPNRSLLEERMQHSLAKALRNNSYVAVAFLDLDGFKDINDAHGHEVGDRILCLSANALSKELRISDILARYGGDEFVAVLDDLSTPQAFEPITQRMLQSISNGIALDDKHISISVSIGVTIFPNDQSNTDQLIRHADQAMYIAKQQGKNCFHLFDVDHDTAVKNQHLELDSIRAGIKQQQFVLFYQPKINMASNIVVGVEALIRWQHPQKGLLLPDTFLTTIEDNDLSVELGEWVIDTAISQFLVWQAQGINMPISVNIDAYHLQHPDFISRLTILMERYPELLPHQIEFEIVETSLLKDINQISQIVVQCKDLGFDFSLDDFGTGYSSLSYLKKLPTDVIKIDRSFVVDMLDCKDDLAIVKGIIELAKAFDRGVIAEGVESVRYGQQLVEMGCQLAQGYGIAKPMPVENIASWLHDWNSKQRWLDQ
jgi:diguanylate cyclase (GGDEF)-like protein/PAS domain S-box-containing protein